MKGDTSIWVTRVMMANNRIAGMWRISRHMAHSGAGTLLSCPGLCVPRVMSAVSNAALAEQPAVIHRIDVMFMTESMNPAKAGPSGEHESGEGWSEEETDAAHALCCAG